MGYTPDRYVAALEFAATRHADQLVPGTKFPYLVHVTSVTCELIAALGPEHDADLAVQCALLHDTIEDTRTSYDDVATAFGKAVADGVQALSKDPALPKEAAMADSLRRIKLQPREVWMVKLADRITNLSEPPAYWTADKRRRYRAEALVIADALGGANAILDNRIRARAAAYDTYIDQATS